MKASRLHEVWTSPDNTRLTLKQYSFRLPLHVAAKLAALGEIYPQQSKTQIVADLLSSALEELEANLPAGVGEPVDEHFQALLEQDHGFGREALYHLGGLEGRFRAAANEHYRLLQMEAGGPPADQLYVEEIGTRAELTKKLER